jgi:hypothetical protein
MRGYIQEEEDKREGNTHMAYYYLLVADNGTDTRVVQLQVHQEDKRTWVEDDSEYWKKEAASSLDKDKGKDKMVALEAAMVMVALVAMVAMVAWGAPEKVGPPV